VARPAVLRVVNCWLAMLSKCVQMRKCLLTNASRSAATAAAAAARDQLQYADRIRELKATPKHLWEQVGLWEASVGSNSSKGLAYAAYYVPI
jgi:hypothetical protein